MGVQGGRLAHLWRGTRGSVWVRDPEKPAALDLPGYELAHFVLGQEGDYAVGELAAAGASRQTEGGRPTRAVKTLRK